MTPEAGPLPAQPARRAGPRGTHPLLRVVLVAVGIVVVVAGCYADYMQTIPPDVEPFSPSVVGVIERHESLPDIAVYTLVSGERVEVTRDFRVLFGGLPVQGSLIGAGTDGTGPWVGFATHVEDSDPDCFRAPGLVLDDGDAIWFAGSRFTKAPDFTTAFPSTQRGARYPVGNPCFNAQFQVVRVGDQ